MRQSLIIAITLLFSSCLNGDPYFEKNYYEKISGIKFPKDYKVLEAFDNGEWLTGAVLQMDSLALVKLVIDNKFDTLQNKINNPILVFSSPHFEKHKPVFPTTKNIYFIRKSKQKNDWCYVADLNTFKLWMEISYPDWGGR